MLDAEQILRIAANPSRNASHEAKVIALAYYLIGDRLADHIGRADNNWYAFATWSSKTIGEGLDLKSGTPLRSNLSTQLCMPILHGRLIRRVGLMLLGRRFQQGVALANRSIFLEMGTFWTDLWSPPGRRCGHRVDQQRARPSQVFKSRFLEDDEKEHEDYLRDAAYLLNKAMSTHEQELRSELIFGANIAMSAYEQKRAQKSLELALCGIVRGFLRVSWRAIWHWLTPWRSFNSSDLYESPHREQPRLVQRVESRWARWQTRNVLSLETPAGVIRLGMPLQSRHAKHPSSPQWRDETVERLVTKFADLSSAQAYAGVQDWSDYEERMRFIVSYFWTFRRDRRFSEMPYRGALADALHSEMEKGPLPDPERSVGMPNSAETDDAAPRCFRLHPNVDPGALA
jgi:hypothetical protein